MPRSKPARVSAKVQPKLRMIANGSDEVNALRAEHACAVAVTRAVAEQAAPRGRQGAVPVGKRQRARRIERGSLSAPPKARVSAFVQLSDDVAGAAAAHPSGRDRRQGQRAHRRALGRRGARARARPAGRERRARPAAADAPTSSSPRRRRPCRPRPRGRSAAARTARARASSSASSTSAASTSRHPDFLDDDGKTRFVAHLGPGRTRRGSPPASAPDDAVRLRRRVRARSDLEHGDRGGAAAQASRPTSSSGSRRWCRLARHPRRQHRRRQPRRLPQGDASPACSSRSPTRTQERRAVVLRLEPARPRRRLPAGARPTSSRLPVSINISLGTNGHAHDGSSAVSRWIDAALTVPGRMRLRRGRQRRARSAPSSTDDIGFVMGRIHTSGQIPARELVRRPRVDGGRQRRRRRLRERARDLVRRAGPLRRLRSGRRARRLDRSGRAGQFIENRQLPRRQLPQHLQRALPPRQRRELHRGLPEPVLRAAERRRRRRRASWLVRLHGHRGPRRPLPRLDRARRPAAARPRRRARGVGLPVVLLRGLERRRLVGQLARLRAARSSRSRTSTSAASGSTSPAARGRRATAGRSRTSPPPARTSSPPTASPTRTTSGSR